MFTKPVRLIGFGIACLLAIAVLASLQGVSPAHAQSSNPPSSLACITCHENQYYLYDTGTWYCITEARDRCVNCHAGDASALTKPEAHAGLVANPLGDGGTRCLDCHAVDAKARIQKVVGFTGYHASIPEKPYIPNQTTASGFPTALDSSDGPGASLWVIPVTLVIFTTWLFLVIRSSRS